MAEDGALIRIPQGDVVTGNETFLTPDRPAPLSAELPAVPDTPLQRLEIPFAGAWIDNTDPSKIGLLNFAELLNLRYTDVGIEGVQGYVQLTTAPVGTYVWFRSGIQFVTRATSYILVQAWDNALNVATVQLYRPTPPATGTFDAAALHTDATGSDLAVFTTAPDGNVAYANGLETLIWGSDAHRMAAVFNIDPTNEAFFYDVTERLSSAANTVALDTWTLVDRSVGTGIYLQIGTTRPIQGITFTVETGNATAGNTSAVTYWNGTTFAAVGGFVDGTISGGISMAQSGTMSFTSTVGLARPRLLENRFLYFYQVAIGAGAAPSITINISQVTVDMPMQSLIDIWDGVERTPVFFGLVVTPASDEFDDYTLEVLQASSAAAPIAAEVGTLTNTQALQFGFEERLTTIKLRLIALTGNTAASVMTLSYWNGTAWAGVAGLVDGTAVSGATLATTGDLTWNPPTPQTEHRTTFAGFTGYFYRITVSLALSGNCLVDLVSAVPAQRWDNIDAQAPGSHAVFAYQNRLLCAGLPQDNLPNVIDYSATNAPDVWNGDDSSDKGKRIFIGDHQAIRAGVELANRFGSDLVHLAVVLKNAQTWVLLGSSPDDFRVQPVSLAVGCPAPRTLVTADVSFSLDAEAVRTVAMWISHRGPMMFDGGALVPMRFRQEDGQMSSIDAYFHEADSRFVNHTTLKFASAWYDAQWNEYNVLLPSGSGQVFNNTWLVCDLARRKWYEKSPDTYPQIGFAVQEVGSAAQHTYGGRDTGDLLHLDTGTTWDGDTINHIVRTADLLLNRSLWDVTLVRHVILAAVTESAHSVNLWYAADGSGVFSLIDTIALAGSGRYQQVTEPYNLRALTHQFRLITATTTTTRAPQLLGLGILARVGRQELT